MRESLYIFFWLDRQAERFASRFAGNHGARLALMIAFSLIGVALTPDGTGIATLTLGLSIGLAGAMWGKRLDALRGFRVARAYWLLTGLGRLALIVPVLPFHLATGVAEGWIGFWARGIGVALGLGIGLSCFRLAFVSHEGDDAKAAPESPRTEYERLAKEAVENERRRRELERHPDIDRR